MQPKMIVIGTTHRIQCGKENNGEIIKQFRNLIYKTCSENQILHIAEEMSIDGLHEIQAKRTIAKEIAEEYGIRHSYLDPDKKLRSELGIDNDMLTNASFGLHSKDVNKLLMNLKSVIAHPIRQRIWIAKMLEINLWPKLFICSECHIKDLEIYINELKVIDLSIQTIY